MSLFFHVPMDDHAPLNVRRRAQWRPFRLGGAAPIRRREGLFRYAVIIKLVRTANTAAAINAIYAFSDGCADECYRGIEVNPQDML